ncbi:MAG: hypothetical protein ACXABG_08950, partial [Promethearchaeota archaeon]
RILSPQIGQTFGVAAPSLIVAVNDGTLDEMWYSLNGSTDIAFINNGTIDAGAWAALSNGPVTLIFYANDSFGLLNSTTVNFNKNAEAPVISIISPTLSSYYGIFAPNFTVEITDADLDTMWYTIDGGATNITFTLNGTINQNNWTALADGVVTLIFYANDTLGNSASELVLINKDTASPTINLISPTTLELLGVNSPSFNVMIDDPILDSMWYSLDDGLTNYTFLTNGTFNQAAWASVSNGTLTIYFYAIDLVGNEAFDTVVVRVDKIIPTITVNLPIDDDIIGSRPTINLTVNDANVDSIWYVIAPYSVIFLNNNTDHLIPLAIWDALLEGPFTIELFTNDTAGNLNNIQIDLTKDTIAPAVNIVYPPANTSYTADPPEITLTISDATLNTTWYTIVGTNFTFEFTATPGTNVITVNQTAWNALSNGDITIVFYANDSLGRLTSDGVTITRNVPEPFDLIAFLTSIPMLIVYGVAVAIVVVLIVLKRRKTHKTSDKEIRKIESLWD